MKQVAGQVRDGRGFWSHQRALQRREEADQAAVLRVRREEAEVVRVFRLEQEALAELRGIRERYGHLKHIAAVFAAVDEAGLLLA